MISREGCSMKFLTAWMDKYALPGNRLCIALELNSCYHVTSLFSFSCLSTLMCRNRNHMCARAHRSTRARFKLAAHCAWIFSICCRLLKIQEAPRLKDTNTGHELGRKTGMKNSAEKMRINGCQFPCGIGNQWSIKPAFPQQTDKIAWIRSAWHFS